MQSMSFFIGLATDCNSNQDVEKEPFRNLEQEPNEKGLEGHRV